MNRQGSQSPAGQLYDYLFLKLVCEACIESNPHPFLIIFINDGMDIIRDPKGAITVIYHHFGNIKVK
jgi:hypothetical protein